MTDISNLLEARASVALDGDTQSESDDAVQARLIAERDVAPSYDEGPAVDSRLSVDRSSPSITPHEIIRRIGLPVTVDERGRFHCPVCNMDYEHAQSMGPHFRLHWQEAGVKLHDIPNMAERVKCPECDARLTRNSLSSHMVTKHGMEDKAGRGMARTYGFDLDAYLNPPPPPPKPEPKAKATPKPKLKYEDRQVQFVVCPFGECGAVHKRKYIYRHLESVHGVPHDESRARGQALPASRHTKAINSKLPIFGRRRGTQQSKALAAVEQADAITPPPSDNAFAEAASTFDFTAISPTDIAIGVIQSQVNGSMPTGLLPDVIEYVDHTRHIVDKLRATRT